VDTEKISKRFNEIEVIPGNGYSPYTGCIVFYCHDTVLDKGVTVKSSDGINNKHKTVKEEYDFVKDLNHYCIVKALDYYEEDDIQYMIMAGQYGGGGRRERWRKIFFQFNEDMARVFMAAFKDGLYYMQKNNILHEDIECANTVYNNFSVAPIFIDFGRSQHKEYSKEWLLDQLKTDRITKQNAFFREITNTGGVYVTEPPHFKFDIKPIIEETFKSEIFS